MKYLLGAILLIVFLCLILSSVSSSREQEIKEWAKKNNYTIVSMENKILDWGQYYYANTKDAFFIYKVVISGGRTFWFRFWIFSTDIEEYNK